MDNRLELSRFSLEGQVAIVTGASRGIGEAGAIALAGAGADVAVASRTVDELERVAGEIRKLGRKALVVKTDIGQMDQIQPLVDKVMAEFGKIDILVNNAGLNFVMPAMEMTQEGWDRLMNTNLKGGFFLSQAAGRIMKEHGGGKIINVASIAGLIVQMNTPHYSIAKAGVIMATKCMAKEWGPYNIRVNCIAPGATETKLLNDVLFGHLSEEETRQRKEGMSGFSPLGRIAHPREIADAMVYLASEASSFMTGQTMVIDGGALS